MKLTPTNLAHKLNGDIVVDREIKLNNIKKVDNKHDLKVNKLVLDRKWN